MNHTPGPWRFRAPEAGTLQRGKVFGPKHKDGGDYAPLADFHNPEDAKLAAAAPEMYDALKALFPHCHERDMMGGSDYEKAWLKAEAAIKKAEGKA